MWYLLVAFVLAFCAQQLAYKKDRGQILWFFAVLLFPPLILILLCLEDLTTQPANKKCPYCAERVLLEAKVCKHCGRDIPEESQKKQNSHE